MTAQSTPQPTTSHLRTLRMMAFAFLTGAILIGVAGAFLADSRAEHVVWMIATPAVVGVVTGIACAFVQRAMLAPVPADAPDPDRMGAARFQTAFFVAIPCAELPVLVSIVLAVAFGASMLAPVVGAIVSVILMVLYVWPSTTRIRSAQQRLDAAGARTRLEERLAG